MREFIGCMLYAHDKEEKPKRKTETKNLYGVFRRRVGVRVSRWPRRLPSKVVVNDTDPPLLLSADLLTGSRLKHAVVAVVGRLPLLLIFFFPILYVHTTWTSKKGSGLNFMSACIVVQEIAKVDPAVAVLVDIQNTLINNMLR